MHVRGSVTVEDITGTTFRGVLQLMKGYKAPDNWLEVFEQNNSKMKMERFKDILEGCEKWKKSRKQGNPYGLTDEEILACGLFTYDLGLNGEKEEVRIVKSIYLQF